MQARVFTLISDLCKLIFLFCLFSISDQGRVIILSIHQPRYSILKLFDSITLLSRGEMIYHGPVRTALPFFTNVLGNNNKIHTTKLLLLPFVV